MSGSASRGRSQAQKDGGKPLPGCSSRRLSAASLSRQTARQHEHVPPLCLHARPAAALARRWHGRATVGASWHSSSKHAPLTHGRRCSASAARSLGRWARMPPERPRATLELPCAYSPRSSRVRPPSNKTTIAIAALFLVFCPAARCTPPAHLLCHTTARSSLLSPILATFTRPLVSRGASPGS